MNYDFPIIKDKVMIDRVNEHMKAKKSGIMVRIGFGCGKKSISIILILGLKLQHMIM